MKAHLSNKTILILNTIFILIFIMGTAIETFENPKYAIIGIICQIISFLYTSCGYILRIVFDATQSEIFIPTDNFTDRQTTINKVIENLNSIFYENNKDIIIPIVCGEADGVGKTELLLKIFQLFNNKSIAKLELDQAHYSLYKRVKKKIGYVYFLNSIDSKKITYIINNKPYVVFKKNLVFVDDCPSLTIDKFNKRSIIIFCQKDNEKLCDRYNKIIKLESFGEKEIKEYYYSKYQKHISDVDLKRIIQYSQGNVSKISTILETERTLEVFRKNVGVIFEIEQYLDSGNYKKARDILDNLTSSQKNDLENDFETKYVLDFLKADLTHLENNYVQSLEMLELLRVNYIADTEKEQKITEKISHVQKHLGNFTKALSEIAVLPDNIRVQKAVSLNLLEYSMKGDDAYLKAAEHNLHLLESNLSLYVSEQKDSYHTYKAVTCIYDEKYAVAHNMIDKAISLYENIDSRFLNNCYFIKAEIYRHENKFKLACGYYQRCLNAYRFNNDIDVYSMAYIMLTFLNIIYKTNHQFEETFSLEEIKTICSEHYMEYNKVLIMKLDELIKTQSNQKADELKSYFDKYVFFIP